jgi:hypothetical protein
MTASRTATITINSEMVSPAKAVMTAARSGPLVILSERAIRDLADELGGYDQAIRHILRIATNVGKPIGINLPIAEGSTTAFIAPGSWTRERLAGWVGARHAELEAAFGEARIVEASA